jgi:prolipoprotein diacylglyceryltransferase
MESVSLLLLSGLLYFGLKTPYAKSRPGIVAGFYLLGAGLIRFVLDFFRGDDRGRLIFGAPPTTIISVVVGLTGLLVLTGLVRSRKLAQV